MLAGSEKEQVLTGEEGPGGDTAAIFGEKEPQHSTAEHRNYWQGVNMNFKVRLGPPKTSEVLIPISRNAEKNELCMISN